MGEYIVSARKYRPSAFDAVVGQEALTTTLKNAIAAGKLAHAYLFCGPRGVGKRLVPAFLPKPSTACTRPTTGRLAMNANHARLSTNSVRSTFMNWTQLQTTRWRKYVP